MTKRTAHYRHPAATAGVARQDLAAGAAAFLLLIAGLITGQLLLLIGP